MTSPSPDLIRLTRLLSKLTIRESAAMVGVTIGTWAKYESGMHAMKPSMWELYNIKLADLDDISNN